MSGCQTECWSNKVAGVCFGTCTKISLILSSVWKAKTSG
jgi:hypothetical protein